MRNLSETNGKVSALPTLHFSRVESHQTTWLEHPWWQVGSAKLYFITLSGISSIKVFQWISFFLLRSFSMLSNLLTENRRIADSFIYADYFLCKAAGKLGISVCYFSVLEDPLERFKLMIAFHVSGLLFTCLDKKPFNPILGTLALFVILIFFFLLSQVKLMKQPLKMEVNYIVNK